MKRKQVNAVIIFGLISFVSILIIQITWIRKTLETQEKSIEIQKKEELLNQRDFENRAYIALRNVLVQAEGEENAAIKFYGAVKQVRPNYYVVDLSAEVQMFYIETLLKREFDNQSLNEDFIYGVYDCFSDSIIFGPTMHYNKSNGFQPQKDEEVQKTAKKLDWKQDGHYFTVLFPSVKQKHIKAVSLDTSPWWYLATVIIVVMFFFAFAIVVILRQKRLSEIKTSTLCCCTISSINFFSLPITPTIRGNCLTNGITIPPPAEYLIS